jgi:hypothetical protein
LKTLARDRCRSDPVIERRLEICKRYASVPADFGRLAIMTLTLDSEFFRLLNAKQAVGDQTPVVYGVPGLSSAEIAAIEDQLGFQLPEDFAFLLQNFQDPGQVLFPWSNFKKQKYDDMIHWILKGIEFDIDENEFWMDRWGKRPMGLSSALDIARRDFATWPKLLPIYGHRFLAAEPCHRDNPVFSIMQTDIIYYGATLAHYLVNEFVDHDYTLHTYAQKIRKIAIWSELCR